MWITEEKLAPNPEYEAIFNEKKTQRVCWVESIALYTWQNGPRCLHFAPVEIFTSHCKMYATLFETGFFFLCILGCQHLYFNIYRESGYVNALTHN